MDGTEWTNPATASVAAVIHSESYPPALRRRLGARNRWESAAKVVASVDADTDHVGWLADTLRDLYRQAAGDAEPRDRFPDRADLGLEDEDRLPRVDVGEVDWRQLARHLLAAVGFGPPDPRAG
jgi:hypothetical protein